MAIMIPLYLGLVMVLQGGMNRKIATTIGLAQTALVGNLLTTIFCLAFYFWAKYTSQNIPQDFEVKESLFTFEWWYLFPAFFGACIVVGLPAAFSRIGAVQVTIGLIAAQVIAGIFWDQMVEKITLSPSKIAGVILAVSSVLVVLLGSSRHS